MDVRTLAARLGVSARAVARAEELQRLAAARMGTSGAAALVRPAVCLDLACGEQRAPVDRKALIRMCGGTSKEYLAQLGALSGVLGLRARCDSRTLGIRFGALVCAHAADHCLAQFKARFVATLDPRAQASADFSRPVFGAAAFLLAAAAAGVRVPRAELCSAAGVAPAELSATVAQMQALCGDLFKDKDKDKGDKEKDKEGEEAPKAAPRRAKAERAAAEAVALPPLPQTAPPLRSPPQRALKSPQPAAKKLQSPPPAAVRGTPAAAAQATPAGGSAGGSARRAAVASPPASTGQRATRSGAAGAAAAGAAAPRSGAKRSRLSFESGPPGGRSAAKTPRSASRRT